jgi:hypothetical protein
MPKSQVKIGTVSETVGNNPTQVSDIISMRDHGIICLALGVGNGSPLHLATYLSALVNGCNQLAKDFGKYEIDIHINGQQYFCENSIRAALINAHQTAQSNPS